MVEPMGSQYFEALSNATDEEIALERKLDNPNTPPEKKGKWRYRLKELQTSIIPDLVRFGPRKK